MYTRNCTDEKFSLFLKSLLLYYKFTEQKQNEECSKGDAPNLYIRAENKHSQHNFLYLSQFTMPSYPYLCYTRTNLLCHHVCAGASLVHCLTFNDSSNAETGSIIHGLFLMIVFIFFIIFL